LADCGAGAEIGNAGELERALEGGMLPSKIMMSGPGKTHDDIAAALLAGIMQINAESLSELRLIEKVASVLGKTARISLRINTHFGVERATQPDPTTKLIKAGFVFDELGEALKIVLSCAHLTFAGLAVHVESNGTDCAAYRACYQKLAMIVGLLRDQGIAVAHIDLGGSCPGADDRAEPFFSEYVALVRDIIQPLGCSLSFETGRSLVGDAGVLVTRLLHVNEGESTPCLVLDAGLNDLMDASLHNMRHEIIPVREDNEPHRSVSITGPLCDANDTFGTSYMIPRTLNAGDLVAIMQTGAYGSAMASSYSGRPLVPEVLVSGAQFALVRRRIAVAEQMGWESIPDWMVIHRAA